MAEKKGKKNIFGGAVRGGRFSKIVFRFSALLFLGVIFYVIFFSRYLSIEKIFIKGLKFIQEDEIMKEAIGEKSEKIFFVLPENNWIFFSSDRLEKKIKEKYKQIKEVEVRKIFPSTLEILVFERTPGFLISSGGKRLIADESGEAYQEADLISSEQKDSLLTISDESEKEILSEDASLRLNYFNFASRAKNELKNSLDLDLEDTFRTPNLISDDLRVKTKEGWEIYFNIRFPVEKYVEILGVALKEKIPREKTKDLEYVDLRIENKVYFKMKEGASLEIKEPSKEKKEVKKKK